MTAGLQFWRHYNTTLSGASMGLGANWSHSYGRRIIVKPLGLWVVVQRDDGRGYDFAKTSAGNWKADADVTAQLVELKSGPVRTGWRLRWLASGDTETYDASGLLLTVTNRTGAMQTLIYDLDVPSGGDGIATTLDRIADSNGRAIDFTHDASGRLATAKDPAGSVFSFGYDAQGNLASVAHTDGSSRAYQYNEYTYTGGANQPNALTGITDENGVRYATYAYDSTGRANNEWHAGNVDQYQLVYGTNATTVTDPLGTQRTYNFTNVLGVTKSTGQSQPGGSGCGPASSSIGYDANGNISRRTDFDGHKTTYTYDLTRNLELTRTEGSGTTAARTISTTWHPDWRLEARRAEPKKLTTWVYNGQPDPSAGNAVATCAPSDALLPDGKPIAVLCKQIEQATTDETGAAGFSATVTGNPRISTWTYTRYGQVLTADGPRTDVNDVTTTTYYDIADSDLGKRGNVATITNALGHVTEYTSYDANGRVTMMTDPNGVTTSFSYDPRGRLTAKTVGGETTSFSYDPVGQLTAISLPDGTSLAYTYDPAHRLTAIADGAGNRVQYTLDAMGNRLKEEVLGPEGHLVRIQTLIYDALGRIKNLVQPQ